MKISVLIPVYNEKDTIVEVLERVSSLPLDKEIIVIDDGSTDNTRQILKEISSKNKNICVILQPENRGKGCAVRTGIEFATGDYVVIQDADLELNVSDITKLVEAVDERHEVIYGSRFLTRNEFPFMNYLANRFLTHLTNVFYRATLTDMETCYKLCSRKILLELQLKSRGFEIEPEITCKILKRGYKIKEIPVSYNPRKKGKKIGWKDGFRAIFTIMRYRLNA